MIYLAGPITRPDPMANAHTACNIATAMVDAGFTPFVPQCSIIWQTIQPRPWAWWLEYDFRILANCSLLMRIPGESQGADAEIKEAKRIGVPVVFLLTCDPQEAVDLAKAALGYVRRNPGRFFAASSRCSGTYYELNHVIFG